MQRSFCVYRIKYFSCNGISVLLTTNVKAIALVKEVNKHGVVEEAAYLCFADKEHREDEERSCQENNLQH